MARTVAGNEIILAMNRMIPPAISRNRMAWNGICFPDFTGLRFPDCPFVSRLGERKYRSAARMIFFQPTGPQGCLDTNTG